MSDGFRKGPNIQGSNKQSPGRLLFAGVGGGELLVPVAVIEDYLFGLLNEGEDGQVVFVKEIDVVMSGITNIEYCFD